MKIWTIQPYYIYQKLLKEKKLYVNPKKMEVLTDSDLKPTFSMAYNYLTKKMEEKIVKPNQSIIYPWWGWHTRNKKHKKPDLRESGYDKKGTISVCMELELPDEDILLTDFDNWHYVLNNAYFSNAKNEKDWEKEEEWFDSLSKEKQMEIKIKSWEKIFQVDLIESDFYTQGIYIQANFWELNLKQVKNVQIFTCR